MPIGGRAIERRYGLYAASLRHGEMKNGRRWSRSGCRAEQWSAWFSHYRRRRSSVVEKLYIWSHRSTETQRTFDTFLSAFPKSRNRAVPQGTESKDLQRRRVVGTHRCNVDSFDQISGASEGGFNWTSVVLVRRVCVCVSVCVQYDVLEREDAPVLQRDDHQRGTGLESPLAFRRRYNQRRKLRLE